MKHDFIMQPIASNLGLNLSKKRSSKEMNEEVSARLFEARVKLEQSATRIKKMNESNYGLHCGESNSF